MLHNFEADQWLPFPLPLVFAFFANPQNLPPLMPAWQQARIEELRLIAPPPPPAGAPARLGTGVGTTMILSFRPIPRLPVRINWHALIPEFEWNDHFCDLQTAGPFRYWRHCHSVSEQMRDGTPGTALHDRVEYELPLGPLGDLLNEVVGKRQMKAAFDYRHRQTEKLMPAFVQHMAARKAVTGGPGAPQASI